MDEPRDHIWLKQQRDRLMTWSKDDLVAWLTWVDPNGVWSDEDMEREGWDPMTVEDAVDQVMLHVRENMETPEEMRRASEKANPGRYW